MFNDTNIDGYFLEYDSDRAGGFEPLRFLPKGNKQLVLGLVTSKSGRLETQGRHQAPHRRGHQICRARPALPVAAMRLRLDRGRQRAGRGRAVGEAAHDRGTGRRGVGEVVAVVPAKAGTHTPHPSISCDRVLELTALARLARPGRQESRRYIDATHQAPVPRRSCRQPAAHRAAEGGARQARARRDHRRRSSRRSRTARSRASSRSRKRSG